MEYQVEYWVDEEARDYGLGEIFDTYDSFKQAKHVAEKIFFSYAAAVEVLDENDEVLFGLYDD